MKTVKNYCERCNYSVDYTKKERVVLTIQNLIYSSFVALGVLFFIFILLAGPSNVVDLMSSSLMMNHARSESYDLRHLAINWSQNCQGTDTLCYAESVFDGVKDVKYVPASKFNVITSPMETYKWGNDCKNLEIMYTSIMKSIGQDSIILCSIDNAHCISKVKLNTTNYIVVDLTLPGMWLMNNTQDPWTYYNDIDGGTRIK